MAASVLLLFSLASLFSNPWEEVGWRGFAQARYHPIVAPLIVGLLWGAWHLPPFLLPPGMMSMAALPFAPWLISILARSFVLTWLFNRAGRSVLISSLFHLAMNVFAAVIGVSSYPALATVEVIAATGLCVLGGPRLGSEEHG